MNSSSVHAEANHVCVYISVALTPNPDPCVYNLWKSNLILSAISVYIRILMYMHCIYTYINVHM